MSAAEPLDSLDPVLEVILGEHETPDWENDGWRCTDDQTAQRLLAQLRQERSEVERIDQAAQAQHADVDAWKARTQRPRLNRIERLEGHLIAYRRHLEAENPALRKTYPLFGGELVRRAVPPRLEVADEPAAIGWCETYAPDLVDVRTVKKLDKRALLSGAGMTPNLHVDADPHQTHEVELTDPFGNRPPVPGVVVVKAADRYSVVTKDETL